MLLMHPFIQTSLKPKEFAAFALDIKMYVQRVKAEKARKAQEQLEKAKQAANKGNVNTDAFYQFYKGLG